jgi:hypothetical protein
VVNSLGIDWADVTKAYIQSKNDAALKSYVPQLLQVWDAVKSTVTPRDERGAAERFYLSTFLDKERGPITEKDISQEDKDRLLSLLENRLAQTITPQELDAQNPSNKYLVKTKPSKKKSNNTDMFDLSKLEDEAYALRDGNTIYKGPGFYRDNVGRFPVGHDIYSNPNSEDPQAYRDANHDLEYALGSFNFNVSPVQDSIVVNDVYDFHKGTELNYPDILSYAWPVLPQVALEQYGILMAPDRKKANNMARPVRIAIPRGLRVPAPEHPANINTPLNPKYDIR